MAISSASRATSLPSPSGSEIDLELLTFIERYATNLVRWDLLLYFGRHPSACDSASTIAKRVGRKTHSVQKELDDLALLGVLRMHANGEGIQYRLTRALPMRRAIIRLARYFDQPRAGRN